MSSNEPSRVALEKSRSLLVAEEQSKALSGQDVGAPEEGVQPPVSSLVAPFIIELLIEAVEEALMDRMVKEKVPLAVHDSMMTTLEMGLYISNLQNVDFPEDDDEEAPEFKAIQGDTWMRLRMKLLPQLSSLQKAAYARTEQPGTPSGLLEAPQTAPAQGQPSAAEEFFNASLNTWRQHAAVFLTDFSDQAEPTAVPLKQNTERPPTAEQKLRTMQEQQNIRNRQIREEEQRRQEIIDKEKQIAKSRWDSLAYDYDGKYLEVKPKDRSKPGVSLTLSIP